MVQQAKPLLAALIFQYLISQHKFKYQHLCSRSSSLLIDAPGKADEDGPSAATCSGNQGEVLSSWFQPGPALDFMAFWGTEPVDERS